MSTETSLQSMTPPRAARTVNSPPTMRRSRMRDASPRVRRPPRWSERVLPRRVA